MHLLDQLMQYVRKYRLTDKSDHGAALPYGVTVDASLAAFVNSNLFASTLYNSVTLY